MKKIKQNLTNATLPLVLVSPFLAAQASEGQILELEPTLVEDSIVSEDSTEVEQSNQVTAYKTGTTLKDTPQSVSVFTKEQIAQQGIDSVADIVDYTPGVTNSQGEGHRDAVVFRGNRSTADFFVDGVRDDVQYYRGLYNVDQVEILKGPNALTFGRGGIGGVFNRVYKKAIIGEEFGEIQGSIDSFGANSTQFDYNNYAGDRAAFRLNAHYDNLENHRDFFEGERIGINPNFTFQLGEATQLNLAYEYADHERFIDRGIPSFDGRPAEELEDITFADRDLNFTTLEAHTFRASLDHKFNDNLKGRLNVFYGDYNKVYSNYFSSDYNRDLNLVELDGYIDTTERERFTLSGDLIGEFSTGSVEHKVLLGGEFIRTSSDQNRLNNVFEEAFDSNGNLLPDPDDQSFFSLANGLALSNGVVRDDSGNILGTGTFTMLNDDTETTISVFSVFLQDEIKVTDKLDLILGARFDSFDIEVIDNNPGTPADERFLDRTDNEVTPRIGLVYRPVDELSLYASYSETFQPRSGEQFADLGGGDDALDPDTASNFEIGAKWDINDRFNFALSGFRIDQTSTENDTQNINIGQLVEIDSETYGVEAQLKGQITDNWYISLGYSYLTGEQSDDDDPELDGNRLITLPSYVRVDASASYDFSEDLSVRLNVENLLDRDYFPNSHTANNITVGAPINARITFTSRF